MYLCLKCTIADFAIYKNQFFLNFVNNGQSLMVQHRSVARSMTLQSLN